MKCTTIYESSSHRWLAFGMDPDKPQQVIDTNQFVICDDRAAILLDPGGVELFPAMLGALTGHISPDQIEHLFLSHQDPDVSSSLPLWRAVAGEKLKVHISKLWTGFVSHFDKEAKFVPLPDAGGDLSLSYDCRLQVLPAHYMHSSGNFNLYDPKAKVYFSGDIGAALIPDEAKGDSMFVEDFTRHVTFMEGFHRRWLPSNEAKNAWVRMLRSFDIEILAPQHGLLFRGEHVGRFLDWLEQLHVGTGMDCYEQREAEQLQAAQQ
jgi:flavorubredoxin